MFKVGELVLNKESKALCEVIEIDDNWGSLRVKLISESGMRKGWTKDVEENDGIAQGFLKDVKSPPTYNPINVKLYPDFVEYKGYLLPAKIAAELKEQDENLK